MKDSYRRRPQDFKRRIIQKNIDKDYLLEHEYKWLQLIPDEEIGKKYYNLSKRHFGHWASNPDQKIIDKSSGKSRYENVREKIKKARAKQVITEETRQKLIKKLIGRPVSEETRQKIREKNLGKIMSEESRRKMSESHTGKKRAPHTENTKLKMKEAALRRWASIQSLAKT